MAVTINGSAGVTTNTGAVYDSIQRATAQASTSGTSIDFTGIPSWVKRITVMFNEVSLVEFILGNGVCGKFGYVNEVVAGSGAAIRTADKSRGNRGARRTWDI